MKSIKYVILSGLLITLMAFSSCTYRLVDFTVISTKNAEIGVDRSKGKQVEGKASYFLGMGWNLKDAIDNALENAGPMYDLLIDGIVSYQSVPFFTIVKVKGVAVSSAQLRAELGEEGFQKWCLENHMLE